MSPPSDSDGPLSSSTSVPDLVQTNAVIEGVLDTWRGAIGSDFDAYRGHVYRVFNFARALARDSANEDTLAVSAAFHDIGIWSDQTFDYLEPSATRAEQYLAEHTLAVDHATVKRMIVLHHKVSRCSVVDGQLVEAFRRADLVDLSWGLLRFGLERGFVRDAQRTFRNAGFHRCLLREGFAWMVRHPLRPLPMMRW
jgi:hypothetical protein